LSGAISVEEAACARSKRAVVADVAVAVVVAVADVAGAGDS